MSAEHAVDPLEALLGQFGETLPHGRHAIARLERSGAALAEGLRDASRRIQRAIDVADRPASRGAETGLDAPDAELVAALRSARAAPASRGEGGPGPVDHGPIEIAQRRLDALLEPLLWASWVETRARGQVVAASTMRWGGDVQTRVIGRPMASVASTHARRLGVVAQQRRARLQLIAVVVAGLTRLAVSASTGGGVAALPALLRFIEQVLGALDAVRVAEMDDDPMPLHRAGAL